jgi:UDP-N-acetylmuramoylalanine--D-glutamate ligase
VIELHNKRVLVVGLARTGRAVAQRLRREGAIVTATDLRPPATFGSALRELMESHVGFELGAHREETFVKQDLIVVSPGVPWHLPQLDAARRRRIPIVPEVEAASWFLHGTLVGITGTNGKTTTTTLLGQILEASEFATYMAGNIGVPLISAVDFFSPDSIVVTELSSFQLEAIRQFRPNVAVLLNITENHLDRHGTFDAYVSAKAQIFRNQQYDDFAILNADDPTVMSLAPVIASRKVFFSLEQDLPEGVLLSNGRILYRVGHLERMLLEEREVKLRGSFNIQNVMAAAAAACILGADFKTIRNVVREFSGVEHRLEFVKSVRGIDFYNDSKATSVDATVKALSTFDRGVHLILGGKDKGAPYTPLQPFLEGRVKTIYLIGSAATQIAQDLAGADLQRAGDLTTAIHMAFSRAVPGDIVLLSPACSSYDQFEDFEQRGRAFKEIVDTLPATVSLVEPAAGLAEHTSAPALDGTSGASTPADLGRREARIEENTPLRPSQRAEPVYIFEIEATEAPPAADSEEPSPEDNSGQNASPAISDSVCQPQEPISPYEVLDTGQGLGHAAEDRTSDAQTAEEAYQAVRSQGKTAGSDSRLERFSEGSAKRPGTD